MTVSALQSSANEWSVRTDKDRADSATRALLLEAAKKVVTERGYARMTVAEITAAAHVGRATFYVYFASKEDVFSVLAHDVRDRFLAAQSLDGLDADDEQAVAEVTVGAYLDAYVENFAFVTVLEHQAIADPQMRTVLDDMQARAWRRSTRYIEHLVAAGRARPAAAPEHVARATAGMLAIHAPMVAAEPHRRDEVAAFLTDMFLRLLGIDPGPAEGEHRPTSGARKSADARSQG